MSEQTELDSTKKCCYSCKKTNANLIQVKNLVFCQNCFDEYFFYCSDCKTIEEISKAKHVKRNKYHGSSVCPKCFNEHYIVCKNCKYGEIKSKIHIFKDAAYCSYCYDTMFVCVSCNERKFRNQYYDGGLCKTCWIEESQIINPNHEAKVPLDFMGKGPHFFGIELEVECDENLNRRPVYAKTVLSLFDGFVITKHDGSIRDENGKVNGFEIVTVPASKTVQYEKWNYFFDNKPKGLKSFDTLTCGLHIHCSRKPLSQLTIAKMLLFVNDSKNIEFITTIAGRNHNRFCKIQKKVIGDYRRPLDRYEALNLINRGTVEFRIFRGTLKRESLFKSIEFCDALIHFCKECEYSINDCRRVDKFIEYVKLRKNDYLHLWAFICARWLREENDLTKKMGFPLPSSPAEIE